MSFTDGNVELDVPPLPARQNFAASNVTDNASGSNLVAAIDGSGGFTGTSHLTIFYMDEDGNLSNAGISGVIPGAINGVANRSEPVLVDLSTTHSRLEEFSLGLF